MHMRVNQPWQHMQPGGVDDFIGGCIGRGAHSFDPPVPHADIGGNFAPGQHSHATPDDQIEMGGHGF